MRRITEMGAGLDPAPIAMSPTTKPKRNPEAPWLTEPLYPDDAPERAGRIRTLLSL